MAARAPFRAAGTTSCARPGMHVARTSKHILCAPLRAAGECPATCQPPSGDLLLSFEHPPLQPFTSAVLHNQTQAHATPTPLLTRPPSTMTSGRASCQQACWRLAEVNLRYPVHWENVTRTRITFLSTCHMYLYMHADAAHACMAPPKPCMRIHASAPTSRAFSRISDPQT